MMETIQWVVIGLLVMTVGVPAIKAKLRGKNKFVGTSSGEK